MDTKKKIGVLIGGSGLVGGTIVNFYKRNYPDSFDIRAPSSKKLSIRVPEDIQNYLREVQPDFVINAAMASLGADGYLAYEVNYLGAINLARAACTLKIPYIHLSSAATLPPGENLTEEDTLALAPTLSNYAKSKLMAELTLKKMAEESGLDYTSIRLAIVYGAHDHKIQGFHRLFFTIADESMPALFTRRDTRHSYTNARKLPFFIHHMLANRPEFSGNIYHFVDPDPVDLTKLIMTIRSYLNLNRPKQIYVPYWMARSGSNVVEFILKFLRRLGLKAALPAELMFLENFYKPQTLNCDKLKQSSFVDPFPKETIFTRLPDLVVYYLTRWSHENLITTFKECRDIERSIEATFAESPEKLLEQMHQAGVGPFPGME